MEGKPVKEVKENPSLPFTSNLLKFCDLPAWVKE